MTKADMQTYRAKLLVLRSRLTGDLSQLQEEALRNTGGEASGKLSSVPIHPADLGNDNFEEEVTLGLLENEDQLLEEIDAALARIEQRTFGRCEECHKPITKARLDAVPYTRLCVNCARKDEGRARR